MPTDTPRARARVEMIDDIKRVAREHLGVEGADLSLRAVARDLGVVSSAVYRYFASRDELLTALIIDGYNSMGEAVEQAEAQIARRDFSGRWVATWRATRAWAVARPHEYALLYGTPIPGYAAPEETIPAAQRILVVAMSVLRDALAAEVLVVPADRLPKAVRSDMQNIANLPDFRSIPATLLARAVLAWTGLLGTISFELFGRYANAISDPDTHFEHQVKMMARYLGMT